MTRPTLANECVQCNAAGQVVFKLKAPRRNGSTHLVMSPLPAACIGLPPFAHRAGVEAVRQCSRSHRRARLRAITKYLGPQLRTVLAPWRTFDSFHGVHLVCWWTPSSHSTSAQSICRGQTLNAQQAEAAFILEHQPHAASLLSLAQDLSAYRAAQFF